MIEFVLLGIVGLIILALLFRKVRRKRREKQWLLFEDVWGTGDKLKKTKYAIRRKTGERREIK